MENMKIDFGSIRDWLRDYGGKPYDKHDATKKALGQAATKNFRNFRDMVLDGLPSLKFDKVDFLSLNRTISRKDFWAQIYDKKYGDIEGHLSVSFGADIDNNQNLRLHIRLESKNDLLTTATIEEKKKVNRKLLQEINGAIYEDGNGKTYNYEEALEQIEADNNYDNNPEFKISPRTYLEGPFTKENTDTIVANGKKIAEQYIDAYYKMVRGNGEKFPKNIILFGPPGTGKTYNSKICAVAICDGKTIEQVETVDYKTEVLKRYKELETEGRIAFTTFHQSYGYEEFIEGIRPSLDKTNDGKIYYEIKPGVFKKFCERASDDKSYNAEAAFNEKWSEFVNDVNDGNVKYGLIKSNSENKDKALYTRDEDTIVLPIGDGLALTKANALKFFRGEEFKHKQYNQIKKVYDYFAEKYLKDIPDIALSENESKAKSEPCVFIIDEINRGNISKIFGELITLIEESKREGADEAMSCTLPYSGETFSVPNNVYILGTMNTADRSIAIMDTALRRRFDFIEMLPDKAALDGIEVDGLNIASLLETINKRIELLYDREHTIGHSYFLPLKESPTIDTLKHIFKNKILPLLQEYFYEDYSKIRLVLGCNDFITEENIDEGDYFKDSVPDGMLQEKKYTISESAFDDIKNYKAII